MQGLAIKSEEDVAWNDYKKNNVAHIFQGQDCTLCTTRVDIRAWKLGNWAVEKKKTMSWVLGGIMEKSREV